MVFFHQNAEGLHLVAPGRHRSPRHGMSPNSRETGPKCVSEVGGQRSMMWWVRGLADIDGLVI
jgi:hypothetical protein